MYRYEYDLHLGDVTSYIKFYSTEEVNCEYIEDEILKLYNTGEYNECDWETGENYINTYDMNKVLVEKHDNWYHTNTDVKYIQGELYL